MNAQQLESNFSITFHIYDKLERENFQYASLLLYFRVVLHESRCSSFANYIMLCVCLFLFVNFYHFNPDLTHLYHLCIYTFLAIHSMFATRRRIIYIPDLNVPRNYVCEWFGDNDWATYILCRPWPCGLSNSIRVRKTIALYAAQLVSVLQNKGRKRLAFSANKNRTR